MSGAASGPGAGIVVGLVAASKSEVAAAPLEQDAPAHAAVAVVQLPAVDRDNIADNAAGRGHIQHTADNIVDIAVADTIVRALVQKPELQLEPENLRMLGVWDQTWVQQYFEKAVSGELQQSPEY